MNQETESHNKYKEKYLRLLREFEKLQNQCQSLMARNIFLTNEIRELEHINDELTEELTNKE